MTAHAYDVKEERPLSDYDITPVELLALVRDGERLWRQEHEGPCELRDVIWKLMGEAAGTLRALPRGFPRSFGSGWPDFEQLSQFAIENARNLERAEALAAGRTFDEDLYLAEDRKIEQPSAAAVKRLLSTLIMLRWIKAKSAAQKKARMKMMLALAAGMSPTRAAAAFKELGYTNKNAVLAARYRSLSMIEARIETKCGKILLNVAA